MLAALPIPLGPFFGLSPSGSSGAESVRVDRPLEVNAVLKTLQPRSFQALLLALGLALAAGCGKKAAPEKPAEPGAAAPGTTAQAPAGMVPVIKGTVLETMDSGGYTYLKLKTDQGEKWTAVNQSSVKVGAKVSVIGPSLMQNFESTTLNRTFEEIYFGTLGTEAGVPAPPDATTMASLASRHAAVATGPDDVGKISVQKAEGADARTVAEVHAKKATLKDKPVTVRGKVVKFLPSIMGRNWIHLRDGSGSRDAKTDDLTVTTTNTVAKDDVVVVKGTVRVDKDFGAGYAYQVIVEEAKVTK